MRGLSQGAWSAEWYSTLPFRSGEVGKLSRNDVRAAGVNIRSVTDQRKKRAAAPDEVTEPASTA
jgi:hypothetical protein